MHVVRCHFAQFGLKWPIDADFLSGVEGSLAVYTRELPMADKGHGRKCYMVAQKVASHCMWVSMFHPSQPSGMGSPTMESMHISQSGTYADGYLGIHPSPAVDI
jgi:hypothetical protein